MQTLTKHLSARVLFIRTVAAAFVVGAGMLALPSFAEAAPVLTPSLSIKKSVDKTSALAGDNLIYTVVVTNSGAGAAMNVTLTDTLPPGLVYFEYLEKSTVLSTKTWFWPKLAAGTSVTVHYKVHIASKSNAQVLENSASVTADGLAAVTAKATTNIKKPVVLGATTDVVSTPDVLPSTGAGILLNLISGSALIGAGLLLRKRSS